MSKIHKIKFWHQNPAVAEMYPAVMGNAMSMDWIQAEFELRKTFDKDRYENHSTVLKCPGIFELYSRGFFVRQPFDVKFRYEKEVDEVFYSNPDMEGFLGKNAHEIYPNFKGFETGFHIKNKENLVDFPLRKDQIPFICNIKSGFRLLSPIPVLFLPIPYADQDEWSSATGVLETNKNLEVNPQLYLNNYHGEDEKTWSIEAGENIMFCIPLTNEKWVIESELSVKDKLFLDIYAMIQTRAHVFCTEYDLHKSSNLSRYATIPKRLKRKLNECWKNLWE